jgi:hypothetical protein
VITRQQPEILLIEDSSADLDVVARIAQFWLGTAVLPEA